MEDHDRRYIPNTFPHSLALPTSIPSLLQQALEELLRCTPPQSSYATGPSHHQHHLKGILTGPTGLAYLFLHLSVSHPKISVAGHPPSHWAEAYIRGDRGPLELKPGTCGLFSEKLSYEAVRACVSKDLGHVKVLVESMAAVHAPVGRCQQDAFPSELLYGRAGALYLLRMVRHFVPNSAALLERAVVLITRRIIDVGDDGQGNWLFHGKRYLGAAHGDIGILAQLVLTTPPLAPTLEDRLNRLLDAQLPDGNWVSSEGRTEAKFVQWCHGATGFVIALLSLRPFFPALQEKVDVAINKARGCIWEKGLLRKEPSLCHGIFGNALALESGPRRTHFLALATPQKMAELKEDDPSLFETAAYGATDSLLMNYWCGAAWTWMVCERENPRFVLYNDV